MKTRFLIASLAFCSLSWPQSSTTEPPNADRVTKVVHVHGNAEALANLSGNGSGAIVQGNNQLRVVVIKGKSSEVANVVRTIEDLETAGPAALAGKDIELAIYVVAGSMEPVAAMPDAPAEMLAPVYKQLRAIFPYKNYQLLDTMLMRSGQNVEASTSGMMKNLQSNADVNMPSMYSIRYDGATVSADTPPSIRLSRFRFEAKVPFVTGAVDAKGKTGTVTYATTTYQQGTIGVETNVDLREGQKIVIGTSSVETANATLFLVVTARIVQ